LKNFEPVAHKKRQESTQTEDLKRKRMLKPMQKFKRHGGKKRFGSGKRFNHKRDMSKVQCYGCHEYGHYKKDCPKLAKKRKVRHHASAANDEEPSKKAKHEEIDFF
jgi:hypothetical protein